jgi:hypothetical protein
MADDATYCAGQGPDWSSATHSMAIGDDIEAQARVACLANHPRRDGVGLPDGCNRSFIEMINEREEYNKYRGWGGARETKKKHQEFLPAVRQVSLARQPALNA